MGPLKRGSQVEPLAEALDIATDAEIYVVPVVVAQRPAAMVVASELDNAFAATRLIDQVAVSIGQILQRLVQERREPRP